MLLTHMSYLCRWLEQPWPARTEAHQQCLVSRALMGFSSGEVGRGETLQCKLRLTVSTELFNTLLPFGT